MFRHRRITRTAAEAMIKDESYKLIENFVSACFEDIYLYYKKTDKEYCVVWYEMNYIPGDHYLFHGSLRGFMNDIFLYYRDDSGSPSDEDLEFIGNARPGKYTELLKYLKHIDAKVLRIAIEDGDRTLETAVVKALKELEEIV